MLASLVEGTAGEMFFPAATSLESAKKSQFGSQLVPWVGGGGGSCWGFPWANGESPLLAPQVSRIAAYAFSALSQIRVDAKEELVVQFGIP